jgi:hypothetical protein
MLSIGLTAGPDGFVLILEMAGIVAAPAKQPYNYIFFSGMKQTGQAQGETRE